MCFVLKMCMCNPFFKESTNLLRKIITYILDYYLQHNPIDGASHFPVSQVLRKFLVERVLDFFVETLPYSIDIVPKSVCVCVGWMDV
jgi:hypothetical protein